MWREVGDPAALFVYGFTGISAPFPGQVMSTLEVGKMGSVFLYFVDEVTSPTNMVIESSTTRWKGKGLSALVVSKSIGYPSNLALRALKDSSPFSKGPLGLWTMVSLGQLLCDLIS